MYLTLQTKVPILHYLGGDVCLYHYMLWSSLANAVNVPLGKGHEIRNGLLAFYGTGA